MRNACRLYLRILRVRPETSGRVCHMPAAAMSAFLLALTASSPALPALARRSAIPVEFDATSTHGFPSRSRSPRTTSRRRPSPTPRSIHRHRTSTSRSRQGTGHCCFPFATTASAERISAGARDSSACKTASKRSAGRSPSKARRAAERRSSSRFRSTPSRCRALRRVRAQRTKGFPARTTLTVHRRRRAAIYRGEDPLRCLLVRVDVRAQSSGSMASSSQTSVRFW